jgi:hypothetical protein
MLAKQLAEKSSLQATSEDFAIHCNNTRIFGGVTLKLLIAASPKLKKPVAHGQ